LVELLNTREQARFYLEQMGTPFAGYQATHDTYVGVRDAPARAVPAACGGSSSSGRSCPTSSSANATWS
jgi:hypothetical protein